MPNFKTTLSLLLLASLFVFACNKDNDEKELDISDLPLEAIMSDNISFMVVSVEEYDGEFEAYLFMMILEQHGNLALKVNGNTIELDGWEGFYGAELALNPGQGFSFELDIDGKKRSGSLTIPDAIQATFPAEFNLNADFSFSWILPEDPTAFVAFLEIDHEEDWINEAVALNGKQRNHTFSRNLFSGLSEEDIWYIEAGIMAINFDIKDNMVFIAGFDAYHEYPFNQNFFRQAEKTVPSKTPRGGFPGLLWNRQMTRE